MDIELKTISGGEYDNGVYVKAGDVLHFTGILKNHHWTPLTNFNLNFF